jgi:predicted dehydrogenase
MENRNRREFIGRSAAALGAAAGGALGANDRVRVVIVGVGGRGRAHIHSIHEIAGDNVELAAICDVDEKFLQLRAAECEKLLGRKIAVHTDLRRVLDDRSIDAVIHATPTNWHGLAGVWTLQAGKDAYIEKPLAHNVAEGRKLIEATRKYRRIVQHGTQCRSSPGILEGVAKLKAGVIGEVFLAKGIGYKWRPSIGRARPQDPPSTLHYDLWLGPAPWKPYAENHLHYNWHWFWDTGNGDMGNIGVHGLDLIRMALDLEDHPTTIQGMGGHYMYDDDREAPDCQSVWFQFAGRKLMVGYEVRSGNTNTEAGLGDPHLFPFRLGRAKRDAQGVVFVGREGIMLFPDYTSYHVFFGPDRKPGPHGAGEGDPLANVPHLRNFFQAVRSRKESELTANVEEGHRSAALCHLGNIATRLRSTLTFDPRKERFAGNPEADRLLGRTCRKPYVMPAV